MRRILSMSYKSANQFLLKSESYSTIELPIYFDFNKVFNNILMVTSGKNMSDFYNSKIKPQDLDDVNYKIVKNKNGKYDWRPIELIHPYLYIQLVELITREDNWKFIKKRFKELQKNKKIICCSIPGESISKKHDKKASIYNWINKVEQETIKLSLQYKYMAITDITNCYSSIYTHTITWALYTEEEAKKKEIRNDKKLLGNQIDELLRKMNYNQTNGIPQGSVLTDFIAEIILGYADEQFTNLLAKADIKIFDYKIIRYRDDYRIFANSEIELNIILKTLTEVLLRLNFKLNTNKTIITDDIIKYSMKSDKYDLLNLNFNCNLELEKNLLIIKQISDKYLNDSKIKVLLTNLYENKLKNIKRKPKNYEQVISIIVDIMINKPGLYNISVAMLSEIFKLLSIEERNFFVSLISLKFKDIPNTEYLSVWLQRLTIIDNRTESYNCKICDKLVNSNIKIWNSSWITFDINEEDIINEEILNEITEVISSEEVDRFNTEGYR